MARIQLFQGLSWDNLPKAETKRVMSVNEIVCRLADLRAEWQMATESEGKTLLETQASVGLILLDICKLMELTPDEAQVVLGPELQEVVYDS